MRVKGLFGGFGGGSRRERENAEDVRSTPSAVLARETASLVLMLCEPSLTSQVSVRLNPRAMARAWAVPCVSP
eukprot:772487-Pyramimonas_sp.AAC.1